MTAAGKVEMRKVALAAAAHPDDIELMMAGTLIRLGELGWELHYHNIATGSCGTEELAREAIIARRLEEARAAAGSIGATWHAPLVNDFEIYYTPQLVAQCAALVREVRPTVLLLPSPQDYMEDHMNASRLMVTAAFVRSMPNFVTEPPRATSAQPMALYHALPWGLCDQLRRRVVPDFGVETAGVIEKQTAMLACHASQKEWLDRSQGLDNYLTTMQAMSARVAAMFGRPGHAEGWRRHHHLGFGAEDFDPLGAVLSEWILNDPEGAAEHGQTPK
jgi:LmbE family N-acetylglucosaminyl deacetylase